MSPGSEHDEWLRDREAMAAEHAARHASRHHQPSVGHGPVGDEIHPVAADEVTTSEDDDEEDDDEVLD